MTTYIMKPRVGPHKFNGEWLQPGDRITCDESEIINVMDKFDKVPDTVVESEPVAVDPDPEPEKIVDDAPDAPPIDETPEIDAENAEDAGEPGPETDTGKLDVVHQGHGKYDVVNASSGKKINDAPLTRKEAYSIAEGK